MMAASNINNNAEGVFVYMGEGEPRVPDDVVHVRVHPSVTEIPYEAFKYRTKLEVVELCEGLLEIGIRAFENCSSLRCIKIPSTVKTIREHCFHDTSLSSVGLHDGVKTIEEWAFYNAKFRLFRLPPSVTKIRGVFSYCKNMFSLELSERIRKIEIWAFADCRSLRNIALPYNVGISSFGGGDPFEGCADLHELFGSNKQIANALQRRFDDLPIHKMIYYQSYQFVTARQRAGHHRVLRSKLDSTGKQQDCLGMTPLHILACSTVQNIELYDVLIERYPENLITEDRWGALPLLYAVWRDAQSEVVQLLVESYQSIYPSYEFNWTKMAETLGSSTAPIEIMKSLLDLRQEHFPQQKIGELNWTKMIETLGLGDATKCTMQNLLDFKEEFFPNEALHWGEVLDASNNPVLSKEAFVNLVQCRFSKRVSYIGLKQWRNEITDFISSYHDYDISSYHEDDDEVDESRRRSFLANIERKLTQYEDEYHKLKEVTTILELALWKKKMDGHGQGEMRGNKKMKLDTSDLRSQCHISCGSDIVIEHVLPYLLPRV